MAKRGLVAMVLAITTGCPGREPHPRPPPSSPVPRCSPTTCSAAMVTCGVIADGCGGAIDCGACPENRCTPTTCKALGKDCGSVPDGCGGMLSCGSCPSGTCGGGGVPNVCGSSCVKTTCQELEKDCGNVPDGCGGMLSCGSCLIGTCGGGGVPNVCGGFGGAGPWPPGSSLYGAAEGIRERPVVGMTTDEAQNLWVATHEALYLLKPGQKHFTRFDATAGLHLASNPVGYCDDDFGGGDRSCPIFGAASSIGITEIVGGAPGEVFVGYAGNDEGSADWADPERHSGKLDRVRLQASGALQVDRFDLASGDHSARYWHDRTVQRMIYDHFIHPHELYVGTNHGVVLLRPDLSRPPPVRGGYFGFDWNNITWMGDHLHARVCFHAPCDDTEANQRMGDWRGLAFTASGDLWTAGRWTAGLIRWDPDTLHWFARPGDQAFAVAFGDPYPFPPNEFGFINEPVFRPPLEGDPVSLGAVSVAPDGKVWFASGQFQWADVAYGIASWDGYRFRVYAPRAEPGMAESDVRDLIALPSGWLVLAGATTGLTFWNPATGEHHRLRAGQGIADDRVQRLELDTMVSPPALHVSTDTGAASIRTLP